ncbi:IclR family transcriptional regulator C-terminal domain-containing protein [Streptomyces sodiiphilus]|uniref:IclR family transcriptional regulator C-terminal domain-containing protein n=1 Tax=Streptomyces sodiiphilus TaxID=226217 RepID=A0ABN2P3S3_9ACTN
MTTGTGDASPPGEAVGPLLRGLAVIEKLAAADGRRPVSELTKAVGLARSTVDRVLSTLEHLGYARLEGRDAVLTPRLMELGNAYLGACGMPALFGPVIDALADDLDESVSLAVPDRESIRLVRQRTRRRAMSLTFRIGDPLPADGAAPGVLFASGWSPEDWAHWRRSRADSGTDAEAAFRERVAAAARAGWAADDQLVEPGLIAVAVPVRAPEGHAVCALSVVSHTSRHSARSLRESVLPRLLGTAAEMEKALASPPAAPTAAARPVPAPRRAKQELGPEYVESLARGLGVLTAFGPGRAALGLSSVAEATGLARATARRALITLEHLGHVAVGERKYRITPRVLNLGFGPLSQLTLTQIAEPHLVNLVKRAQDSASMAVLAGTDIRYVARVPTVRIMAVNITLGTRFPAYATAMGRVLLAGLPPEERSALLAGATLEPLTRHTATAPARLMEILEETARTGHALVNEELEEGLRSLAVPVRDHTGRVVAAVNVSMHASRRTVDQARNDLLPALRETASAIEADLHPAGRYLQISDA